MINSIENKISANYEGKIYLYSKDYKSLDNNLKSNKNKESFPFYSADDCTYYFLTTTWSDGSITSTFLFKNCTTSNYYPFSKSYNSSNGKYGNSNPKIAPINSVFSNFDSLPTNIKDKLLNELIAFLSKSCLNRAIYSALVNKNLQFSLDPTISSGGYNPTSNIFFVRDLNNLTVQNLEEELFHAYQNFNYQGGISQYLNTGFSNIEFESKLFQDINNLGSPTLAIRGTININDLQGYVDYLDDLTDEFKKTPKSLSNIQNGLYRYFISIFKKEQPQYNKPSNSLLPQAMLKLFNDSNCL